MNIREFQQLIREAEGCELDIDGLTEVQFVSRDNLDIKFIPDGAWDFDEDDDILTFYLV